MDGVEMVTIERDALELDHAKEGARVLCVFFGGYVWGSTTDPDQASKFPREEAQRLLDRGRWAGLNPTIKGES